MLVVKRVACRGVVGRSGRIKARWSGDGRTRRAVSNKQAECAAGAKDGRRNDRVGEDAGNGPGGGRRRE